MSTEVLTREIGSEVASYAGNLEGVPKERFAEERASYSMETKRIPDPYYYTLDQGGDLYHPEGRTKVKNFISRDTYVEELEYQSFIQTENWFRQADTGSIVWVSPPSLGIYPTSKIIISEIEGQSRQKRLLNRAIVLDFNEEKCVKLAQDLSVFSENHPLFNHPDQVRSTPIVLNTRDRSWLHILEEVINDPVLWRIVKEGLDKKAKKEAIQYAGEIYQRLFRGGVEALDGQRMMVGMFGSKQASCPLISRGSASRVMFGSSMLLGGNSLESDQYGSLEFKCPRCPVINKRPWGGKLSSCQSCGASIGC